MASSDFSNGSDFPGGCWDPWLLKDDDHYRLFYLSGNPDQDPWWKTGWIGGAVSTDLKHWRNQGAVLEPLPEQPWESGRIFAGSCYKDDGQYYLFYSAANAQEFDQETLGLAISSDGKTWQRQPAPLLKLPTEDPIYGRCHSTGHLHWRDPAIYKDEASGKYYLYFCAFLAGMGSETANFLGGLGLAISDQLAGPYQLLSPAMGPSRETAIAWPFYHLERPQILYREGQFHLFFSCFKDYVNPQWLSEIGADSITDSTLYWYVADRISGPFRPITTVPIVPGSNETGLYGTQFFPIEETGDEGELLVLGWFHKTYQMAISQEFKATYSSGQFVDTLQIIANF